MPQKLRLAVNAVPNGPWSMLADRFEASGAEVLRLAADAGPADIPDGWVPDGLITTPAAHQSARFDQLDLERWAAAADHELNTRFHLGQLVARRMLAGAGGSIVHLVAAEGMPGAANAGSAATIGYASAGLSRGIALDLKGRLRSNVIAVTPDSASLDAAVALSLLFCSAEGQAITGQIAAIGPSELQLFAQSRPLRIAHRDGGWDEASLAAQVARWAAYLPRLADPVEVL